MALLETTTGPIAYDERGDGKPIVLLSSGAHDRHDFDDLRDLLPPRFRSIAADWPAHGESPAGEGAATAMRFADVAEELVERLAPERRDRRRQLGRRLCRRPAGDPPAGAGPRPRPRRQRRLPRPRPPGPRLLRADGAASLPARDLSLVRQPLHAPERRRGSPRRDVGIATTRQDPGLRAVSELWGSFASPEHDLRAEAASITAPTLVVWGKRDPVIPLKVGRKVAATIPGAELERLRHRPRASGQRSAGLRRRSHAVCRRRVFEGPTRRSARMSEPHRWRSELLGELRSLELAGGTLDYFERGEGPTLLFSHGWLANANLWRKVVDLLCGEFRCLVLDLPLGSHRTPMDADADLSPARRRRPDRRGGRAARPGRGDAGRQRLRRRLLPDRPCPARRAPRRARLPPRSHLLRDALRRVAASALRRPAGRGARPAGARAAPRRTRGPGGAGDPRSPTASCSSTRSSPRRRIPTPCRRAATRACCATSPRRWRRPRPPRSAPPAST